MPGVKLIKCPFCKENLLCLLTLFCIILQDPLVLLPQGARAAAPFRDSHFFYSSTVAPRRNGDGLSSSSHTQEEWKKWSTTFASSLPLNPPHCKIYYSVTIENAQKLTSTKDFVGSKDIFFLDQDPGSRFIRD